MYTNLFVPALVYGVVMIALTFVAAELGGVLQVHVCGSSIT